MAKSLNIIGAGMGGLAAGIYGQMNGYQTQIFELRSLESPDPPAVSMLFDAALGSGFWSLDHGSQGCCHVATADGIVVGAGVAAITARIDEASDVRGPIGLIRLVAVDETMRRQGVATLLVKSLSRDCAEAGVSALAAFAWARGDSGVCSLSGVLRGLGFAKRCRLDHFYAAEGDTPCPACRRAPCVCSADLYIKEPL